MQHTSFVLGTAVVLVILRLWSTLRVLPWGPAKAVIWGAAAVLLCVHVVQTVRIARRVSGGGSQQAVRDVYALASFGLILAVLALSVPHYLPR